MAHVICQVDNCIQGNSNYTVLGFCWDLFASCTAFIGLIVTVTFLEQRFGNTIGPLYHTYATFQNNGTWSWYLEYIDNIPLHQRMLRCKKMYTWLSDIMLPKEARKF